MEFDLRTGERTAEARSPGGSRDGEERAAGAEAEGKNETSALGRGRGGGRLSLHRALIGLLRHLC